jgi:phosphoglycerate dehydrogenase-like enzyme
MALTLMLATLRKVSDYHAAMRQGTEKWVKVFPTDIDPEERELAGRAVGIVGFGAIGRRLAELLEPFRCDLRVHDPFVAPAEAARYGARRAGLLELVRKSDVVVLAAASNESTSHLLGRSQIAAMHEGAILVNVSRAALVDTAALLARLRRREIYAAIDVFDEEPLPRQAELRRQPHAFLTPHRAGGTLASVERIIGWLADDLENHLAGRPLKHAVTEATIPALDR